MPKRSKIVSGKVIAAVEQSRFADKIITAHLNESAEKTAPCETSPAEVLVIKDVRTRFQDRKNELELNRHANDPINIRRAEKRRTAEEKKKKRQQKRLVDGPSKDLLGKNGSNNDSSDDAKRVKFGSCAVEESNFVFNRLEESEVQSSQMLKKTKSISDPKQALQKLQAQKDKLEKLKATDSGKGEALEEKLRLKKALQKAEGISIKDDVNLLKKSIQRRDKEKAKSRQVWSEKKIEQQEKKDKMQAKRTENIQSRIDAKKNKKMGIKVKKPQKSYGGKKGKFNKK